MKLNLPITLASKEGTEEFKRRIGEVITWLGKLEDCHRGVIGYWNTIDKTTGIYALLGLAAQACYASHRAESRCDVGHRGGCRVEVVLGKLRKEVGSILRMPFVKRSRHGRGGREGAQATA